MSPRHFYSDLLGMPADTAWLEVAAPFRAEQLEVRIASQVSTRYQQRQASLVPIVELIAQQYEHMPGNYLAFFSSFEYLQQVADLLAERHGQIPLWAQAPGMDEAARQAFLDRFVADGRGVGFAVLGGAFGEGVDLPGTRLIGAFVATLGLPQVNPVNEQFKQRLGRQFGAGFDYTYLYPGVRKVIQAAGRVIRGDQDRGVLVLIDERFAEPRVQQMFPAWWPKAAPASTPLMTKARSDCGKITNHASCKALYIKVMALHRGLMECVLGIRQDLFLCRFDLLQGLPVSRPAAASLQGSRFVRSPQKSAAAVHGPPGPLQPANHALHPSGRCRPAWLCRLQCR